MKRRIVALEDEIRRLQGALLDMSMQEVAASHKANHDELTALPNRALLVDRFLQAAANADRKNNTVAMLFIDMDHFKHVNDEFGHLVGDKVLKMVALRIRETIRATDTACRYGGDEFVVMLTQLAAAATSGDLAEKIRERLAQPYEVDSNSITLDSSIGVAIYPRDGMAFEIVMCHADAAMYRNKQRRKRTDVKPMTTQFRPAADICD
ncbi:MAG: GGDEF domain-containing protein [Rudaea sp.]